MDTQLNEHEQKEIKHSGKTFEELLNEQLANEGGLDGETKDVEPKKHNFLKKNSRVLVPKAAKKPKPKDQKGGEEGKTDSANEATPQEDRRETKAGVRPERKVPPKSFANRDSMKERRDSEAEEQEDEGKSYNALDYVKKNEEAGEVKTFDDQEEWNDLDNQQQGKQSKVVDAYFKSEKDKKDNKRLKDRKESKEEEMVTNKAVNEKIEELNQEIKKLKQEKDKVKVTRRKLEDDTKAMEKEREAFQKMMEEERAKLTDEKEEELRKIKKEKKVADRNQKAVANMPNRKEREEIDGLKDKLNKQAEDFNSREKKLKFTVERQKKQIDELLKRNKELEDEVHVYEQLRLKSGGASGLGAGNKVSLEVREPEGKKPIKVTKSPMEGEKKGYESRLMEAQEELVDFERTEIRLEEETGGNEDSDKGEKKGGVHESDHFRMKIDPNQYAYSANVHYIEYLQNKGKSK